MQVCHHCGREIRLLAELQRTDTCAFCHADLKCCLGCRFFDPSVSNQCREPQADYVLDKDKANFCEFFELRQVSTIGRPGLGGAQSTQAGARAAFDSLFGKSQKK